MDEIDKLPDDANILTDEELLAMGGVADHSNDNSTFFADLGGLRPLENKKIISILEFFVTEYQKKLTSFLRKKINVQFSSIKICKLDDYSDKDTRMIFTSFAINQGTHFGLVLYDYQFLHTVINLLYGGKVNPHDPMMKSLGKSGQRIAEKFALMSLSVLEKAMSEHGLAALTILKTGEQLGLVLNQTSPERHYEVALQVSFQDLQTSLCFIIPSSFFEGLTFDAPLDLKASQAPLSEMNFSELLQQELVDSTVTLEAFLPSMPLKIKDAMNLKAGDLIAISDPTMVELSLNQKKLFKALVGRASERRVVKIIDRI